MGGWAICWLGMRDIELYYLLHFICWSVACAGRMLPRSARVGLIDSAKMI